ncbi:MAG: SIMPL domain-containing protein [Gammaproteobacteria bacterium]|nr:SIMPL domain-containing protein [Gammaproteobacteria bacterium]
MTTRAHPAVTLLVATLLTTAVAATTVAATALAQTNGIHVSGQGSLEVEPDMGYVSMHVRREGSDPAELRREIDKVVRAILKLVRNLKIAESDVTTAALSINPRYRRRDSETVVDGVIATQTILITLRNLDLFGRLLNRSLEEGVNNVDPIRLDTSRRVELENQALEVAMKDAREEAARVALGLDLRLGQALNVQVVSHSPRPQMALMEMRSAGNSATFNPGLIRVERNVQVTFAIDSTSQ